MVLGKWEFIYRGNEEDEQKGGKRGEKQAKQDTKLGAKPQVVPTVWEFAYSNDSSLPVFYSLNKPWEYKFYF